MTSSILGRITDENVKGDPFPFVLTTEALEPDYYQSLAQHFPDFSDHPETVANNTLAHMSGLHAFADEIEIHPNWQGFMRFHFSQEFFNQITHFLGDHIRSCYPDLESRMGKKVEELTVQPREIEDQGADLLVDVQFAINTPVKKKSRVRCRHVDSPKKLFNGLLYMRSPEDDIDGGDLEICRWKEKPKFRSVFVQDDWVDVVDIVKYQANTLILFINTPESVHGVTPRMPTPLPRRYINILAEFREPLYDIQALQDDETPWALKLGRRGPAN